MVDQNTFEFDLWIAWFCTHYLDQVVRNRAKASFLRETMYLAIRIFRALALTTAPRCAAMSKTVLPGPSILCKWVES